MHQSNLPQEWETVFLKDIVTPKQWKTISTKELLNSGYVVYGANGKIGFYSEYTHKDPTIMITCRGATCGNLHISEPYSYINGNAMALDNLKKEYISQKYLFNSLRNIGFKDVITGSAQPQITRASLLEYKLPLAPLPEQTHLATLLDDLTARVQKIQESLDKIPALLKTFRQSVLARAVSGELTEKWREDNGVAFEWESKKLGEYLILKNGFAFKTKDYCEKSDDTIPIIRISDIDGKFSTSENAIHTKFEVSNFNVRQGDLLIAMSGATTGKMGIYIGDEPAYQNQRVGNMKFLDETGNNSFRNILMFSLQQQIFDLAHGGAQPNISGKSIENIKILLPALEEQTQIVDKVEHYFTLADEIERQTKLAQEKVNYLTQSILAKAFRGELTANWRAANQAVISGENSAKALLAKIENELKKGKK